MGLGFYLFIRSRSVAIPLLLSMYLSAVESRYVLEKGSASCLTRHIESAGSTLHAPAGERGIASKRCGIQTTVE